MVDELAVSHNFGVIGYFDRFIMTCSVCPDLFVPWIIQRTACVTRYGFADARDFFEIIFCAPEATTRVTDKRAVVAAVNKCFMAPFLSSSFEVPVTFGCA